MLDMREIPLTQGKVALVSDEDFDELSKWKWYAARARNTFYARRKEWLGNDKERDIYMHRQILGLDLASSVDHRDGDGLNNTRDNLRPASNRENLTNRSAQSNNTSGYKGVSWYAPRGTWQMRVRSNGKLKSGYYKTKEAAARAYDAAAREMHGEFARLNFKET